jgi:hypothetical protein
VRSAALENLTVRDPTKWYAIGRRKFGKLLREL